MKTSSVVRRQAEEAADAGDEIDHVLVGEGVVERQHRPGMGDLPKAPEGAAPTLREGESSRTSSGKRASIAALRPLQRVVFGIGDGRRVLGMVAPVVLGDLVGKPRELGGGLVLGQLIDRLFRFGHGYRINVQRGGLWPEGGTGFKRPAQCCCQVATCIA